MPDGRVTISGQKDMLLQYIKKASRSQKSKPKGSLQLSSSHGTIQYYRHTVPGNKHGTYIPKTEQKLIQALAQKDYDQKFLQKANQLLEEIKELEKLGVDRSIGFLYQSLAKVYSDLGEARRKLVVPYVKPDDMYIQDWEAQEYTGNPYALPSDEIITEKGEYVRSKSEKIIADKLFSMHIPYLYEFPLQLENGEIVYPDFTLLHVWERRIVIMEHHGMMQDPDYSLKTIKKIGDYEDSGYEEGYNLIYTFESANQPLNIKRIERKLKRVMFYLD